MQDDRTDSCEITGATRRELLAGALAVLGLGLASPLEGVAAQAPASAPAAMPLDPLRIGEIVRRDGKLRGVITVRSVKEGRMPAEAGVDPDLTVTAIRFFEGANAAGDVVWPPAPAPGELRRPFPGPTLRARVGDQVELTYLNHIELDHFEGSGIDKAERGEDGGCDTLLASTPPPYYPDRAGDGPRDGRPRRCFHGSSTVNLHFHGTHVTPDGLGDNVLLQLRPNKDVTEGSVRADFERIFASGPPTKWMDLPETWRNKQKDLLEKHDKEAFWKGEQGKLPEEFWLSRAAQKMIDAGLWPQFQVGAYPYCFKLTEYTVDDNGKPTRYQMGQCPGTHWYHAHKHGSTAINVLHGMVGAFVIEGDYDDALAKLDPRLKQTERVLIVQNFAERPNLLRGNLDPDASRFDRPELWVNGRFQPTITVQPGEIQLWRLVNASIRAVNTLMGFVSQGGAAPEIRQTAQDGVQFNFENYRKQPFLRFPPTGTPPSNTFAPGNRVDLLVKAPLQPGLYEFRVKDTTRNSVHSLLTLKVEGPPIAPPMEFPDDITTYPAFPSFLNDIDPNTIRIRRTLDFGWEPGRVKEGRLEEHSRAPEFRIDGRFFSGDRYDQTMVLGDAEEWTLTNSTTKIAHPFHIHVNPFQVVEIYDPSAPDQLYRPNRNFVWHDVIAIPPAVVDATGKVERGYVKIRHRFVDFPGSYVLHCHMLAHEDRGMMQLIRVVPAGGEATVVPHH